MHRRSRHEALSWRHVLPRRKMDCSATPGRHTCPCPPHQHHHTHTHRHPGPHARPPTSHHHGSVLPARNYAHEEAEYQVYQVGDGAYEIQHRQRRHREGQGVVEGDRQGHHKGGVGEVDERGVAHPAGGGCGERLRAGGCEGGPGGGAAAWPMDRRQRRAGDAGGRGKGERWATWMQTGEGSPDRDNGAGRVQERDEAEVSVGFQGRGLHPLEISAIAGPGARGHGAQRCRRHLHAVSGPRHGCSSISTSLRALSNQCMRRAEWLR